MQLHVQISHDSWHRLVHVDLKAERDSSMLTLETAAANTTSTQGPFTPEAPEVSKWTLR